MSIFERLGDLVRSNVNDLIDRAEDPEKTVKQAIIDMEEQLKKVTQSLGNAIASLNQVTKQLNDAQAESDSWKEKAKTCLAADKQDLARQALDNKVAKDKQVEQYTQMRDTMQAQVNEIKNQADLLKQKLEEARSQQAMLVARSRMADAKENMAKTLGDMDSKSAFAKMDKMERKIEEKEARADAFSNMSGIESSEEDPFAQMDKDTAIDSEMQKLREEMGL